jgi:hypothetical protein
VVPTGVRVSVPFINSHALRTAEAKAAAFSAQVRALSAWNSPMMAVAEESSGVMCCASMRASVDWRAAAAEAPYRGPLWGRGWRSSRISSLMAERTA